MREYRGVKWTPFTTPSGQTGRDAYMYEACAIANRYRELNARFARLLKAAHDEHPEMFDNSSDFDPVLNGTAMHAASFVEYIRDAR